MKKSRPGFADIYQRFGTLLLLAVLFIIACFVSPNFLTSGNLVNVLRQISVVGILACGSTFLLISGNLNIAYDGLIAFLGCISCLIMTYTGNMLLAIIVPVVLGTVIGWLFGVMVTTFQVPAFIVGLAFTSISSGAILLITKGSMISSTGLGNFKILGQGYLGVIPVCVLIMLAVIAVSHIVLASSCFGRKVYAVGGNKAAASASGVNVNSVIRRVYVVDGIFLAIGSILYMSRLNHGDPTGGSGYAFDALTAACVGGVSISGGTGHIPGAFIGAAIVGILNNIMHLANIDANWQQVVSGLVIIVAVSVDMFMQIRTANNAHKNMHAGKAA